MKIRDQADEEKENLKLLAKGFMHEVEKALSKIRKEKVRLFLPENEQYRLLKLRSWVSMYSVDLPYILSKLLPFWQQFVRKRTKRILTEGLGVRVGTLCGKKSEEMLRNLIKEDFPARQNVLLRNSHLQEEIINRALKNNKEVKTTIDLDRSMNDFSDPKGYLQYYKRRMRKQSLIRDKVIEQMLTRPYRGNPFI